MTAPPPSPRPKSPQFLSNTIPKTLIKQGAEAHLYQTTFLTTSLPCLLKHRPSKPYRHPLLDARLTRHRCLSEARLLVRMRRELDRARVVGSGGCGAGDASGGVEGGDEGKEGEEGVHLWAQATVPAVYFVDELRGEIYMEWIEGQTVREVLDGYLSRAVAVVLKDKNDTQTKTKDLDIHIHTLMTSIGTAISQMHSNDVIHGDLTTSNIMLRSASSSSSSTQQVVLIDFGLGSVSASDEDMAVDLYVLERAFISTHPRAEELFREVLEGYERGMGKKGGQVMRRLAEVRLRGRKRSMLG